MFTISDEQLSQLQIPEQLFKVKSDKHEMDV
jgi:hypothetical protein